MPGGYSPGFLEKDPQAIRILREFLDAGKPVAMICHGPRLLLKHGLAKGRTLTCLFSVPDELADEWAGRPFGRYLDQAVVRDGNLLTARYPNDVRFGIGGPGPYGVQGAQLARTGRDPFVMGLVAFSLLFFGLMFMVWERVERYPSKRSRLAA